MLGSAPNYASPGNQTAPSRPSLHGTGSILGAKYGGFGADDAIDEDAAAFDAAANPLQVPTQVPTQETGRLDLADHADAVFTVRNVLVGVSLLAVGYLLGVNAQEKERGWA